MPSSSCVVGGIGFGLGLCSQQGEPVVFSIVIILEVDGRSHEAPVLTTFVSA